MNYIQLCKSENFDNISVVVPISGGKDSQSCLKLALEDYPPEEILGLFCDTQFEHPATYKHIQYMQELYNVKIITISEGSVPELVELKKKFPSMKTRFCTERLKIDPSKNFYKSLAEYQGKGFQVWLGMRANESRDRATRYRNVIHTDLYNPEDIIKRYPKNLTTLGVRFRLPILEWSWAETLNFLDGHENPLYKGQFSRVGCFPCLASGDLVKRQAFDFDEFGKSQRSLVREYEIKLNLSIYTSKSGQAQEVQDLLDKANGCAFCSI